MGPVYPKVLTSTVPSSTRGCSHVPYPHDASAGEATANRTAKEGIPASFITPETLKK